MDWAETKAAYRFFRNKQVDAKAIVAAYRDKTAQRVRAHDTVLAIQDSSYFVYTSHLTTKGLGEIAMKKGNHVEKIYSKGRVMHACLAVTSEGLPLVKRVEKLGDGSSRLLLKWDGHPCPSIPVKFL